MSASAVRLAPVSVAHDELRRARKFLRELLDYREILDMKIADCRNEIQTLLATAYLRKEHNG